MQDFLFLTIYIIRYNIRTISSITQQNHNRSVIDLLNINQNTKFATLLLKLKNDS